MAKFSELLRGARTGERYWLSRVKFDLAAQLQDLLKRSGLNQERYAEKLGVKPPQVSRTLSGSANPTLETVVKMAFTLGYVPHVTFRPLQSVARASEVTTQRIDGINIEITKLASTASSYRFDPPVPEFRSDGWKVRSCNDERFDLAA